jgi:hypothetical protein
MGTNAGRLSVPEGTHITRSKGCTIVEWREESPPGLTSSVYYYRLQAGNLVSTK